MSAQTASADVAEVVTRRMLGGANLVTRSLPAALLKDVASAADFPRMLIAILHSIPTIDPDDLRAVETLDRTAEFKRDLIKRAGGALTTEQVRKLLGYKSAQAVRKAVASGRLLAVVDNGHALHPAFQFDGAAILTGMATVISATPTTKPWALLQFLVEGDEGLGDESPMDMLKGDAETLERLLRFAAKLEV